MEVEQTEQCSKKADESPVSVFSEKNHQNNAPNATIDHFHIYSTEAHSPTKPSHVDVELI